MHRGYYKTWRKIEDCSSWSRGLIFRGLMHTILTRVNYRPSFFCGEKIEAGSCAVSILRLCEELKMSRSNLQKYLKILEQDDFIKCENRGNRFTLITVVNWALYQVDMENCGNGNYNHEGNGEVNRVATVRSTECKPSANREGTSKELKNIRKKEDKNINTYCTEPAEPSLVPNEILTPEILPAVQEDIFIALPLNDKTHRKILKSEIEIWQDLYPAISVEQELRNMFGWLEGNPSRRKTKVGVNRFIQAWLGKAQDKGGSGYAMQVQNGQCHPAPTTFAQVQQLNKQTVARIALDGLSKLKEAENGDNESDRSASVEFWNNL